MKDDLARLTAICIVGLAFATSSSAIAKNYVYTATTGAAVKVAGKVVAGNIGWSCGGKRCTVSGPWPTPGVGSCAALAKKVGRITSYGHPGKRLPKQQLKQCNKGITVAQGSPTRKKKPSVGTTALAIPSSAAGKNYVYTATTAAAVRVQDPQIMAIQQNLQQAGQLQRKLSDQYKATSAQITRVGQAVSRKQQQELTQIGKLLARNPNSRAAQEKWKLLIRNFGAQQPIDVNALVQRVLRESYLEASKDLQYGANKVKLYNRQKKKIRTEIKRARAYLTKYSSAGETSFSIAYKPDYRLAKEGLVSARKPIVNKAKLNAYIRELDAKLASTSNDAQMANVDLQNMNQKQQQLLQMLSSVMKTWREMAIGIIRNMS